MRNEQKIQSLWKQLYGGEQAELNRLVEYLWKLHRDFPQQRQQAFPTKGLVYSTYADAFGDGLDGVRSQLPRLKTLGVTVLWLLPLLESPSRDQGFDISDYTKVDPRFGGNQALSNLLSEARPLGIAIIFDIAVNHTSDRHPWFLAAQDPASPFRDYYYWSETGREFPLAPLVFPGLVDSNWTWRPEAKAWNFHRFYPFQPDLNYRNPRVAFEMVRILTEWKAFGIDGFRMDAAALLWKQEGTDCDSLPQVHWLLKLFQACLDFVAPGSLLLAEANVGPETLLAYFGDGDECKAAYHFELMPRFYQALLEHDPRRLAETRFPVLPRGCAWFTFLRLHDEVTLDLVPGSERSALVRAYTKTPDSEFRNGQAFSGRLFDLFDRDPDKTLVAWSLLFSLPGTPILYYGDEIGMGNNPEYFETKALETGFRDSRFLHRGPWDYALEARSTTEVGSPEGRLRQGLEAMLAFRRDHPDLIAEPPEVSVNGSVLTSVRRHGGKVLTIANDLAAFTHRWTLD
jgi:maltose alpha-D-glucosyltransferase/alpha-amylase